MVTCYIGPAFDSRWYTLKYGQHLLPGEGALSHYLKGGRLAGFKPNAKTLELIIPRDPCRFSEQDLQGEIFVISSAGIFDKDWYAGKYDVLPSEAIRDYLVRGAYEGLDPNPVFSSKNYFKNNKDVALAGTNPLWHYVVCGFGEGRCGAFRPHIDNDSIFDEEMWLYGI